MSYTTHKEKDRLDKMCDEDLSLAAAGDEGAFGVLVSRYLYAVKARAHHYKGCGVELEDLSQEGLIGLMSAARTYDITCGTSFKTYAWLCIDRSIITAVKSTLAKKQIPPSSLVHIGEGRDLEENAEDPAVAVIAKEDFKKFYNNAKGILSSLEYNVLKGYLAGLSYKEIAERMKIPVKTVDNAMRRVRRKLK